MLVLVNLDDPRQTVPLPSYDKTQEVAQREGWVQFAAVSQHDLFTEETRDLLRMPTGGQPDNGNARVVGDVLSATLVRDGYVYEIELTEDAVRVAGRESTISVPRDALDGE